jgi:hypothetical protein
MRGLEFEKQHPYPATRKQSYEYLLQAYLEIGDNEKSKFYRDKFKNLNDSLDYIRRKDANATMKKMVKEADAEHEESSKQQWIITGAIVLITGLITAILWRRKIKPSASNMSR